ncbi:multicopper oxidase-domain-containing protein [Calycina marina]|uniref:Multicopper oxidase-domain-containing protein n=1 Tax=Calycina marina TaxID=1763456 RepID=A0A9P7Z9C4_9HELO|nr:multicopper oxidase-domain-containing protein [Calycina marina]
MNTYSSTTASNLHVTRNYNLSVTWEKHSPDGFERNVFKINNQFPAPLLEFDEGDKAIVIVNNNSPYALTLHWHGIEQLHTPWSDGVPGISQTPIQPGCSFTYRWTNTQHGPYFYHSHYAGQFNDGLYGPLIVHPKPGTAKPWRFISKDIKTINAIEKAEHDRLPLLLSDWRHGESTLLDEVAKEANADLLCMDSVLVNGKGKVSCLTPAEQQPLIGPGLTRALASVPNAKLTDKSCVPPEALKAFGPPFGIAAPDLELLADFPSIFYGCKATTARAEVTTIKQSVCDKETWQFFDMIGSFGMFAFMVSIDEVDAWIVSLDGNYIEPIPVDAMVIGNGQRFTVLARFKKAKRYTLRLSNLADPQILFGESVIDFQIEGKVQAKTPSKPYIDRRGNPVRGGVLIFDGGVAKPHPSTKIPATVDATYKVTMQLAGALQKWALNVTATPDVENIPTPYLFDPMPGLQDNHTITVPSAASWVDYIMQSAPFGPPHPMHVHGRHFYILGSGDGDFNWPTVAAAAAERPELFNLINPQLRDTYNTPISGPTGSWLAVRRASDNEGAWLLHCHIQSHVQGGMAMVIQDGTDSYPRIPDEYRNYQYGGSMGKK